jgi:hypothetical protein
MEKQTDPMPSFATLQQAAKLLNYERSKKTRLKERELSSFWRKTDESDRQSPTQL